MSQDSDSTLYLVDGSSYVFRAFHAIGYLSSPEGVPTNAVFGVMKMLRRLYAEKRPSRLAVVMDPGGKNFRHQLYPDYKANRPPAPEELKVQLPLVRRGIEALGLPLVERAGFEADDVIATLCRQAVEAGLQVVIVTGDKDLMQLVGERVTVFDPMRETTYDRTGVMDKLGVPPEQVVDLLALMGDSSDNIPGVEGVGAKTAARLLSEHADLEALLAAAPGMKKGKLREHLVEQAEQARLSQRLATLCREVPLEQGLDELRPAEPEPASLDAFLVEMGFDSLRTQLVVKKSLPTDRTRTVRDLAALEEVLSAIRRSAEFAVDLETTGLDPMRAQVVGISLCWAPGETAYVPVAHVGPGAGEQLPLSEVIGRLTPLLQDPALKRYGQNAKYDAIVLAEACGVRLGPLSCDPMIASYLLDPGRNSHGLDALARDFLEHRTIRYEEVAGKGRAQIPFAEVPVEAAAAYSGEDAEVTLRLAQLLRVRLEAEGLAGLFDELELPLSQVLVDMERAGVLLDPAPLLVLGGELKTQMAAAEERIYNLAGHEFNIASPVQLRQVLFEELGLAVKKKTKSGPSTDQTVLEELAAEHPLPLEILEYRSLAKLRSTYVDVLPGMIHPETGRIHTSFNQTVAATGRLSSSDPNLQNIPIRTDNGRRIREAFVAPPGQLLLSADYSQVELRILAHVSRDPALLEAFRSGEDIHARTASRLFDLPVERVTSEMRRRAKAVNFGILYGQGPYNLARQLRISRAEAKAIIDAYLARYPGVAAWVAETHERARRDGFVSTLFGRRRFLPDIGSNNFNARSNAERMAQNTPIQGTAADIIKRAMLAIHRALAQRGLRSRMVLQVHDELVCEVPEEELHLLEALVREKMEGAAELSVPLTVDVASGRCWLDAH